MLKTIDIKLFPSFYELRTLIRKLLLFRLPILVKIVSYALSWCWNVSMAITE
ncbi:unnamed protein product, partial [Nesidiocoris tenuis]